MNPTNLDEYQYPTLEDELASAAAIVIGTVTSKHAVKDPADWDGYEAFYYSLRVESQLVGNVPSSILMRTWNDSGGYRMEVGQTHLLFLDKKGNYFTANICGNSGALSERQDVLSKLTAKTVGEAHAD